MREIPVEQITETVKRLCIEAACNLPGDAEQLIKKIRLWKNPIWEIYLPADSRKY